jgi:acyl dehydratase
VKRSLELTAERLVAYSRRGNFHSDPEVAASIGYEKLVAQGMQSFGPAYGLLLDEWGEDFLAHGTVVLKFVGMVVEGETVEAEVALEAGGGEAAIEVRDVTTGSTAVVGRASRTTPIG